MRRARIHGQSCRCRACTGARSTGLGAASTATVAHTACLAGGLICAALFALLAL